MLVDFWVAPASAEVAAKLKAGGIMCLIVGAWSHQTFRDERVEICSRWRHVAEDKGDECMTAEWGGTDELKLLAIAADISIVVIDVSNQHGSWDEFNQGIIIYTPSLSEGDSHAGCIYPNMQGDRLHCLQNNHNEKTLYMVFSGVHYNPILFTGIGRGGLCGGSWSDLQVTGGKGHEREETSRTKRPKR